MVASCGKHHKPLLFSFLLLNRALACRIVISFKTVMDDWWKTFFDADYMRIWGAAANASETAQQAQAIWELLALQEGTRVLDAPCGYGRIDPALAVLQIALPFCSPRLLSGSVQGRRPRHGRPHRHPRRTRLIAPRMGRCLPR